MTECRPLPVRPCDARERGLFGRVNGRYGLLTIWEGGGTANVTIIERIDGSLRKMTPSGMPAGQSIRTGGEVAVVRLPR